LQAKLRGLNCFGWKWEKREEKIKGENEEKKWGKVAYYFLVLRKKRRNLRTIFCKQKIGEIFCQEKIRQVKMKGKICIIFGKRKTKICIQVLKSLNFAQKIPT
jgi:hypothetical protein